MIGAVRFKVAEMQPAKPNSVACAYAALGAGKDIEARQSLRQRRPRKANPPSCPSSPRITPGKFADQTIDDFQRKRHAGVLREIIQDRVRLVGRAYQRLRSATRKYPVTESTSRPL